MSQVWNVEIKYYIFTLFQLSNICNRLDELWEENKGEVTLFLWMSFLQDESVEFLSLQTPLDLSDVIKPRTRSYRKSVSQNDTDDEPASGAKLGATTSSIDASSDDRAMQDIASQDLLLPTILEYNKERIAQSFQTTLFTCQVCFSEKLGALCLQFSGCNHVYCKECMKGYFEVQINDGSVKCLSCPSDKCESQAYPAQVSSQILLDKHFYFCCFMVTLL